MPVSEWTPVPLEDFIPAGEVRSSLSPASPSINCIGYYRTTGDALAKTRQLMLDLREIALQVDPAKLLRQFSQTIDGAVRLLEHFQVLKGEHAFLETNWIDGQFVVCPKDPRSPETREKMRRKGWTI